MSGTPIRMTREKRKALEDEQFRILAQAMDKQAHYFNLLREYAEKHGPARIPTEHQAGWLAARLHGKRPWRDDPAVVRRIRKAARKMAKNIIQGKTLAAKKVVDVAGD